MRTLLDRLAYIISFWCAYGWTWFEMHMHDVDIYLYAHMNNPLMSADAECRKYDCQRRLDTMLINWNRR